MRQALNSRLALGARQPASRGGDQLLNVLPVDHLGQGSCTPGTGDRGRRIVDRQPVAVQEAVELADAGELAGRGAARHALGLQHRKVIADIVGRGILEPASVLLKVIAIGLEIAAVGRDRVPGGATLGSHHFEEARDQPVCSCHLSAAAASRREAPSRSRSAPAENSPAPCAPIDDAADRRDDQ